MSSRSRPEMIPGFRLERLRPGELVRETSHTRSQVRVVLKGACRLRSDAATTLIEGSYAALVPGRAGFDQQAEEDGALLASIVLPKPVKTSFSEKREMPDVPPHWIGRIEDSHSYFLISGFLSANLAATRGAQTGAIVAELSNHLATGAWQRPGGNPDGLSEVVDEIYHRGIKPPVMAELADIANLHPMSLARKFRQIRGCSIGEFRQRMRAERAFYLIIKSSMCLSQVSLNCGFADQSHMTRHFVRYLGITPSKLRHAVGNSAANLMN